MTENNDFEYEELKRENLVEDESKYKKFYDKLRAKFGRKTNHKFDKISDYLFLLPDFFMLLIRLLKDKRVSKKQKVFIVAIVGYVISPIDIIPDFIPIIGFVDDLVLVVYALNMILNDIESEIIQDNWSGETEMLAKLQEITAMAENMLDKKVLRQIKKWIFKNKENK